MYPYLLALILAVQTPPQSATADEIKDTLNRAEALYFEARFADSIQLLMRANEALQSRTDRVPEKISVKLQLALAYIGMNNTNAAKLLLVDIYGLDSNYALDTQQFSPKVIALASEAKLEQNRLRCMMAGQEARKSIEAGNTAAFLEIFRSPKPKCIEVAAVEPAAAELFYKKGLAEYKRAEFPQASESLQTALQLSPEHEFAAQYLDLAQSKLQVAKDRILIQWQKNYDSRLFTLAAADYRQILSMKDGDTMANQARTEYRKALTSLVDSWNRTCSSGDWPRMSEINNQISELLPDPSFGEDIRKQMVPCAKPEPKAVAAQPLVMPKPPVVEAKLDLPAPPKPQTCLRMDSTSALVRLKTRVEPDFPPPARVFIQNGRINLTIKARIDEMGNVKVVDLQGGNSAINGPVRTAVERWKFSPAMDVTGTRCVETDLQMTIGR